MGGLTKEWFLLLCKKIFDADYGMFNYNKESGTYWFNTVEFENYQEYNLVGVLMGLAVYNSTILDIRFGLGVWVLGGKQQFSNTNRDLNGLIKKRESNAWNSKMSYLFRFPKCCYKKLLSPAVVPYGNPNATGGFRGCL